MIAIAYCKVCKDKLILTEEIQSCSCEGFMAQIGKSGEPEAAGGNAVIIKMDEDKIIAVCDAASLFEEENVIVVDPSFQATKSDDPDGQVYKVV
jgi:hypothetical protein